MQNRSPAAPGRSHFRPSDAGMTFDLSQFRKDSVAWLKSDVRQPEVRAAENIDRHAIPESHHTMTALRHR